MQEYAIIGIFAFLGTLFVGGALLLSRLVSYTSAPSSHKHEPYECSESVMGNARIQFKIGYYVYALIFLLFDVEALFLFPCLVNFKEIVAGHVPSISIEVLFIEVFVFLGILISGLVFAWKKGVLNWE